MEAYETQAMGIRRTQEFERWFDKYIGTYYERNDNGDGTYYIVCFDLTYGEVQKCRRHENYMDYKPMMKTKVLMNRDSQTAPDRIEITATLNGHEHKGVYEDEKWSMRKAEIDFAQKLAKADHDYKMAGYRV